MLTILLLSAPSLAAEHVTILGLARTSFLEASGCGGCDFAVRRKAEGLLANCEFNYIILHSIGGILSISLYQKTKTPTLVQYRKYMHNYILQIRTIIDTRDETTVTI